MTEKQHWVTDDLCLIEETTGVKLYGTVCTDITFIAKQLNDANKTIRELEKENKELKDKLENGICPLCGARVSKCGGLQKYKGDLE